MKDPLCAGANSVSKLPFTIVIRYFNRIAALFLLVAMVAAVCSDCGYYPAYSLLTYL
jgi:hypothetical protein